MMMKAKRQHGFSALKTTVFSLLLWTSVVAEEGGAGHYMPGGLGTVIDTPPTKDGWVVEPIYMHYSGDASLGRSFPQAGLLTAGLEASSDAYMLGALYTFKPLVLGAHYTVGAYLPVVAMEVTGLLDTALGSVARTEAVTNLGDISLIPAMLAWKSGSWQFDALLTVYAPTGDYEMGRLANTGMNYWTFEPTIGINYNKEKSGFNLAVHTGLTLNTENSDTHYESGSVLHTEASITQLLPFGKGYLGIGANAFLYEQVTGDSGKGAKLGGFESRSIGVGPSLMYILPIGENTLAAEVKWIPERDTENRLEGDGLWVKVAYQF
jgi:hypothetical protein